MEYKMTMHLKHNCYPTDHVMSQEEIDVMFGGRNWESWQNQMIRLIVENKARDKAISEIGDEDIYLDKSSTVIGCRESIEPMSIVSTDCKEIVVEQGSERYYFEGEEDENCEMWYNIVAFEDDVKFMKHCIRNGVKAYQSENEDKFAATEDDYE